MIYNRIEVAEVYLNSWELVLVSPIRFAVLVVLVDVGLVVVEGETLGVALIHLKEEVVGWIDRIVATVDWRSVVVVDD